MERWKKYHPFYYKCSICIISPSLFLGFRDRFQDAMKKYNITCPCIARVFIIIPKSCTFPKPGTQFEREEHVGALEAVVDGYRKYFLQLYKVTLSDGRVRFNKLYFSIGDQGEVLMGNVCIKL